jgi:hypothetical protein
VAPEIDLEKGGTPIASGGRVDFGSVKANAGTAPVVFTIRNPGTAALNLTGTQKVDISGTDASMFTIDAQPASTVTAAVKPEERSTSRRSACGRLGLLSGSTLKVTVTRGAGITVAVIDTDGAEVAPQGEATWEIDTTQGYVIVIDSPTGPVTFALSVEVAETERETGDWILATDGLIYKGTKLALGSPAQTVIDKVLGFLGHGVRGAYDEFDTGWYTITDPVDNGLRGIFIEGFALLFYGPDPNNPDRPETFVRHRFVGPGRNAAGEPRPDNYATTAEGITVGDTLADLKAAYGSAVTAGSNDEEHWYRLVYSTGDLCFYFDTDDAPTDYSLISEIASECRG